VTALDVAFKEWSIVDSALGAAEQTVLIRKGGIHEKHGRFEVEHERFLIYPTRLHQSPDMLKEPWRSRLAKSDDSPGAASSDSNKLAESPGGLESVKNAPGRAGIQALIALRHFVTVQDIFLAPPEEHMARWDALHIYSPELIRARHHYRPDRPLYILLVRVYRLATPHSIIETSAYAGCRSWVRLNEKVDATDALAVLDEQSFAAAREHIRTIAPWLGHTEVNRG
jgi:hypothetical protein